MNEENKKFEFYTAEEDESSALMPDLDSADKIVKDLLQAEKDIVSENLFLLKSKYEKEKANWERIFSQKEQEALSFRAQLTEAQGRLKQLQSQFDNEKHNTLEQMKERIREIEDKKLSDEKKWEQVRDEIGRFKEEANIAEKKYSKEQDKTSRIKKTFLEQQISLSEVLKQKEEELMDAKEDFLRKEEGWLHEKRRLDEEISILKDQVAGLEQIVKDERQSNDKTNERKDTKLNSVEDAYKNTLAQLNLKLQKEKELENALYEKQNTIKNIEDEKDKLRHEAEQNHMQYRKTLAEEQSKAEKTAKETALREEYLKKEAEKQLKHVVNQVQILEQQFSEEQKLRKDTETMLVQKEQEIQRLINQRDELVNEWKRVVSDEQLNFKKRQSEILSEFNRVSQNKDEEINKLSRNSNELSAALSEEKRIFFLEKERNQQVNSKLMYLEEDKKRLIEHMASKEKDWQVILLNEQEFLRKQIEEIKLKNISQVQSRENELARLSKEMDLINSQFAELKNRYHIEKNESSNRLDKIQELEITIKKLNEKYDMSMQDWQKKHQFAQLENENLVSQRRKEIALRNTAENKNRQLIEDNKSLKEKLDR